MTHRSLMPIHAYQYRTASCPLPQTHPCRPYGAKCRKSTNKPMTTRIQVNHSPSTLPTTRLSPALSSASNARAGQVVPTARSGARMGNGGRAPR